MIRDFSGDVRFGVRLLSRSPIFTVFAVASLTLGLGAMIAIFSLFDGIVLRKLPVANPDELVVASFGRPTGRYNYSLPYPQFELIRQRNTTLSGIFAVHPFGRVTLSVRGEAGIAQGLYVTGDYYRVLGLAPAAGRLIHPSDDRLGEAVAVLSHAYWHRRFGGRPDVVGTAVMLNHVPFTIVGVEPAGFAGTEVGRPYDVSVPMRARDALTDDAPMWNSAFSTWIYVVGRLRPGVTLAQAEPELKTLFAQASLDGVRQPSHERLAREYQLRLESAATGAASDLRDTHQRWLRLIFMVLGSVLLLASLNLATLLLARADSRQREISTRLALGASRTRIVRQLLTESMVLATLGGVLGFVLGSWGSRLLLRIAAPAADGLPIDLAPDLRLVAFTIAASVAACVLFGLIPALRATFARRVASGRQVGGGRRRVVDRVLVGAQVAVSLVLLAGAALFVRTLSHLWSQDPGYDRRNVLMFSVDARLAGHTGDAVPRVYRELLEALRTIPGADHATASAVRPVSDSYYFVSVVSRVGETILPSDKQIRIAFNTIAPGYFATLGMPLVAGRDFDDRDTAGAPKVVIISERLARHFTGDPVGQTLSAEGTHLVIGVAKDARYANVTDAPREVLYFPLFQAQPRHIFYSPTFELRYAGGMTAILPFVREGIARVDSRLQMFRVKTLEEQTQDSLSRERLLAVLTTYGGVFALVLACIGLYGLASYAVTLRTAEIGLRMALGAQAASVRWMIVRDAALTVIAGTAAGLIGALAAARVVRSQLQGIQTHDPIAIAGATVLLLAMALVAAYVPARRASRIDPLRALRHE